MLERPSYRPGFGFAAWKTDHREKQAFDAEATYLIGMPQMSLGGLSENWLLKECGHLHWVGLARRHGLIVPDFKDSTGRQLYAAFTALKLSNARLSFIRENSRLNIKTCLTNLSRAQFGSIHKVTSEGILIGKVELISVFVTRATHNDNRSIIRSSAITHIDVDSRLSDPTFDPSLSRLARKIRKEQWVEHRGFCRLAAMEIKTTIWRPCPMSDFNGADFLYFANFQRFADCAEWEWNCDSGAIRRTAVREIFYSGNINVGEQVKIVLSGTIHSESRAVESAWCRVIRPLDNEIIANIFTQKCLE